MSFDIFVQGFGGEPVDMSSVVRLVLAPLLSADGGTISTIDGVADVYGALDEPLHGLMFNHVDGEQAWDVIFEIARATAWAIMPIGGPVCVTSEEQVERLPEEIRASGIEYVTSGAGLRAIVAA